MSQNTKNWCFLNIFPQNANEILTGAMENTPQMQIFVSPIVTKWNKL
jgi:hypothetical protein